MRTIPSDSTDAREQREQEQLEAAEAAAADAARRAQALELERAHDEGCTGGWLGDDPDGRPIPCLRCRPHLAHKPKVLAVQR